MSDTDTAKLSGLLERFRDLESQGATTPSSTQRAQRSEILDELQELVGLGGRMVTERDILTRANQLLGK